MTFIYSTGIHVVGIGIGEQLAQQIMPEAIIVLKQCDVVIGSERQLALLLDSGLSASAQRITLPKLKELKKLIENALSRSKSIAILASGDPLFFGIGRWFGNNFTADQLVFYPAVSSVQAACHQMGLSLQDVHVISLHGRPLASLKRHLKPYKTLVVLTDKNSQPQHLAQTVLASGFNADITVCENMGFDDQHIKHFSVQELNDSSVVFAALHISILQCGDGIDSYLPCFPGIADHAFIVDVNRIEVKSSKRSSGMITKREVRLNLCSLLAPSNGDVIWDVGAGCGGMAIELSFWNDRASVYAIEHHDERLVCLYENQTRFGVMQNLHIIAGRAPEALAKLPTANKVFMGGSDGQFLDIFQQVWAQLPMGGMVVASAITEETKSHCLSLFTNIGHEADVKTLQLSVSHGETLAGQLMYRPNLPVTVYQFIKRANVNNKAIKYDN